MIPIAIDGNLNFAGNGFAGANCKASIYVFIFLNLPMPTMKRGEHVPWYVMTMGGQANYDTPYWHGSVVTLDKRNL
jgi:hypothetical protein